MQIPHLQFRHILQGLLGQRLGSIQVPWSLAKTVQVGLCHRIGIPLPIVDIVDVGHVVALVHRQGPGFLAAGEGKHHQRRLTAGGDFGKFLLPQAALGRQGNEGLHQTLYRVLLQRQGRITFQHPVVFTALEQRNVGVAALVGKPVYLFRRKGARRRSLGGFPIAGYCKQRQHYGQQQNNSRHHQQRQHLFTIHMHPPHLNGDAGSDRSQPLQLRIEGAAPA